ncbi:MAG: hypothetical protein KC414_04305, partial [Romboutsia sp.]|nr:hypothetical protein [Romboutsia sp.]
DKGICFSYSPFDNQIVFNASMKAVRLLAQIYSINKDPKVKELADSAVKFVMNYQREDGAWVYSDKLNKRIDNYHTGYVLTCLKEYIDMTGDKKYKEQMQKGFVFYKTNFIEEDGAPKFYNNKKHPIDCTSASQSIITLVEFGEIELANKVAAYMITNMFDKDGYFYFRQFKTYLIKTPFMRWAQAWMFAALTQLLYQNK